MRSAELDGRVALVAGATRGAGRGIARALGERGAIVYCTGRSSREFPGSRPETIDETAELVDAAGGEGRAVRVDHESPEQVSDLVERIKAEAGRLDVVVNDIWGGDTLTSWGLPFWEGSLDDGLRMFRQAIDAHVITSHRTIPLLLDSDRGLLVEITDGESYVYRGQFFYDLVKTAAIRMAWALAEELKESNVTALAVTPGFLRSEAMLDHFGVSESNWRDGIAKDPHFAASETPLFVGRAIAALAADADVSKKRGTVWSSWRLSDEYHFIDADGSRPHWGRHLETAAPELVPPLCDDAFYRHWTMRSGS